MCTWKAIPYSALSGFDLPRPFVLWEKFEKQSRHNQHLAIMYGVVGNKIHSKHSMLRQMSSNDNLSYAVVDQQASWKGTLYNFSTSQQPTLQIVRV